MFTSEKISSRGNARSTRIAWPWPLICAGALLALRLVLLPFSTELSNAFTHDSAYIGIVARNLVNGKGLVNDASWLVFLHPARLPMPFHNANPLYPLMTAFAAKTIDISVLRAGLLVSALASVGLFLAAFYLVSYWLKNTRVALLIALAATLFPPIWESSLRMLPDEPHLTFLIAALAFFVRADKLPSCIAAGIFFGAAWLTRSTALLIAPALVVYALLTWRRPLALKRLALCGILALAIASPWLIYTARVWGSPFRSDASYYAFQDIYALKYGGSIHRYWRSPETPISVPELLRTEGGVIVRHVLAGIPTVIKSWLREGWERRYLPRIVFIALLLAVGVSCRRHFLAPALLASLVYAGVQIAVLALRSASIEARYMAPLTAITVLWLGYGIALLLYSRTLLVPGRYAIVAACVVLACYMPFQDLVLLRENTGDGDAAARRRSRKALSAAITHLDPVIVFDPYYYTFDTGAQALSIPNSSDAYLLQYMDQYHVRWIILTADEVRFWKPHWSQHLPPSLRLRGVFDGNMLFERSVSAFGD